MDSSTINIMIDRLFFAMREIDAAVEKTLKNLQSDDPSETRAVILQILAAHDDIVGKNRKIRFDQPCYGLEIADIMYRFLQMLSPFAYGKIREMYTEYKTHIGIRVNIRDNLEKKKKKRQEN